MVSTLVRESARSSDCDTLQIHSKYHTHPLHSSAANSLPNRDHDRILLIAHVTRRRAREFEFQLSEQTNYHHHHHHLVQLFEEVMEKTGRSTINTISQRYTMAYQHDQPSRSH